MMEPQAQIELERRIVHGLGCEWDEAAAGLPEPVRRRLRRPLFALADFARRWGTWSRERQEIVLSRTLVHHHAWGDVRDVLLHETAHQVADQALDALGEPPHGPAFHRACSLLGADPHASGSFPTLLERIDRAADADGDRSLRLIRKLLRLAGSPNRHEAEAAMIKAHALIARHTRSRIAANAPREYVSAFLGEPALRHSRSCYHLAVLLRDFYYVLPVWVPAYVLAKGRMGRVLEISGTAKNVQTAARVAALIAGVSQREWAESGVRGGRFDDFVLCIVEGFRTRMETPAPAEERVRARALQKIVDPGLDAYGRRRYGRLVHRSGAPVRTDRRALEAGRRIGRTLVVADRSAERLTATTARLPQPSPAGGRSSSTD